MHLRPHPNMHVSASPAPVGRARRHGLRRKAGPPVRGAAAHGSSDPKHDSSRALIGGSCGGQAIQKLVCSVRDRWRINRSSGSAARGGTCGHFLRSRGGWLVSSCGVCSKDSIRTTGSRCRRSDLESVKSKFTLLGHIGCFTWRRGTRRPTSYTPLRRRHRRRALAICGSVATGLVR